MSTDKTSESDSRPQPISPAKRRRLQQSFEHGTRNSNKGDHKYANDMFNQCVTGDPGNLIYAQSFLGNLQKQYNNNKKGRKLAGLKGAGPKTAIKKSLVKKNWEGVVKSACNMLAINPWDLTTLLAIAKACEELEHDECQLFYLRTALDANPKDPEVNRASGFALERMGQFDQAIACWHRVELVKSGDEEAQNMISNLTVNKTIQQGGYEDKLSDSQDSGAGKAAEQAPTKPQLTKEQTLENAIARNPEEVSNYLSLSEYYVVNDRLDDAESCLQKAMEATGGGDLSVRERLEDVLMLRGTRQIEIAEQKAHAEKTEESIALLKSIKRDANRKELEIYAARCERTPGHSGLYYELGLRLKRAGKFNEAIQNLQTARGDARRKASVLIELGECFQAIKQYKLAMNNYEQAVEASSERDPNIQKEAFYHVARLAMGLKDLDTAEKYLTDLAGLDFGYKDVAERLDKISQLRNKG